jgi:GH24 family phage-related lysozyme (muramidase)
MKSFKQHLQEKNMLGKLTGVGLAFAAASSMMAGTKPPAPTQKTTQKAPAKPAQAAPKKTYQNDAIKKMVIGDEGMRLKAYKDTKGLMTVGVGHNLQAKNSAAAFTKAFGSSGASIRDSVMKGGSLTKEQATKLFDADYDEHLQRTVKLIPNLHTYPADVQSVLVSGVYRGHVADSPTFRKHFNAGNYDAAMKEFLNRKEYTNPAKDKNGKIIAPGVITRLNRDHSVLSKYAASVKK